LTNLRWEHKDDAKKIKSPDIATFSDSIILMADVKGIVEGGAVTFTLYDNEQNPPNKIDSVQGKNENGIGTVIWEVKESSDGNTEKPPKLEFEASAKSKTSLMKEIKLEIREFEFSF
jgi:hypothetical protein